MPALGVTPASSDRAEGQQIVATEFVSQRQNDAASQRSSGSSDTTSLQKQRNPESTSGDVPCQQTAHSPFNYKDHSAGLGRCSELVELSQPKDSQDRRGKALWLWPFASRRRC